MYTKIEIKGEIKLETGMHIGGSAQFSAIGAIDSPVIRDMESDLPMIPGSSLKGKMRTLLARKYNDGPRKHDEDVPEILRLFGSAAKGKPCRSRLIFSDSILSNMDAFREIGIHGATEVKVENSINRLSAVANPRQIERVIRGSIFPFSIIYDAENEKEFSEDMAMLAEGMPLLEYDYLGGHGSRGYGKVTFHDVTLQPVVGEITEELLNKSRGYFVNFQKSSGDMSR